MRDDYGQMHIDYLIGIAIFLTSVIFVFTYTTGLFTPFQSNSDEVTLIADRIATNLIEQNMSAESIRTPNMLSSTKVDDFFNSGDYESKINHYGMKSSYLHYDFNVTLDNIDTGTFYSTGKTLPVYGNIGQTKRIVIIQDDTTGDETLGILAVRVW
ncbi:hypothetical protein RE474_05730 [Methanolobus sediminis]|uniref:Uncharacterized protein n=1 Tax=Methanolobus sediminis TaxID=3072978 RepID=A0AA51UMB9_9EURY|nr:hypothetical protein [Methanolobus sediminis]WMW26211.1 hypothetical protein RE474_05730 [Methanolobus sediminis]